MPEPPRTQRYEGLFQSQTQEMFEADARSAAEHDWYPASQNWTGTVLFVVYEHDQGRRFPATPATHPGAKPGANPAAAPALQAFEADSTPAGSRRRRVAIGVGVGVGMVIVALLVVTMIGSQVLDRRPATGDRQSGGNAAPTPAAAAVVLSSPLGSRTAAVEQFRASGFSGVLAPLVDGRERWRGTDQRSSVAEVIGPEDRITEVSLAVQILRGEKRNNKARSADLDTLFASYAPLAAQWAADQLDAMEAAVPRRIEQRFGDLLVRLVSMPVKGGAAVKFQIMTD